MANEQEPTEVQEARFMHEVEQINQAYGAEGIRLFFQNMWGDFSGHTSESFVRKHQATVPTPNPSRSELRNQQPDLEYQNTLDQVAVELDQSDEIETIIDEFYEAADQESRTQDRTAENLHRLEQARKEILNRLYLGPLKVVYARMRAMGYNHFDLTGLTEEELRKDLAEMKK